MRGERIGMFKKRKTIIRIVALILCILIVISVFSILMATLTSM